MSVRKHTRMTDVHGSRAAPSCLSPCAGEKASLGHEKLTNEASPEFNEEYQSFFHTIEQFRVLKTFQTDLYLLTGLPFDFVDLRLWHSRNLQAQRKFTPFCKMVNTGPLGCKACDSDERLAVADCVKSQGCVLRRCHLGLIDIYVPIVMNSKVVGLLCTGQLFYQHPTQKHFQGIKERLVSMGIDLTRARKAYFSIPVIEKRRVLAIADLVQMVVGLIDTRRLQTLKTVMTRDPLRKTLDLLEAHYAEPVTLPVVAKKVGLSVSRLSHLFKAQIRMSFTAYLGLIRIHWAKYYLMNSHLRVSEVAFQVGFGNLSHFNHVFRCLTGLSPSQYRQQHASTRI